MLDWVKIAPWAKYHSYYQVPPPLPLSSKTQLLTYIGGMWISKGTIWELGMESTKELYETLDEIIWNLPLVYSYKINWLIEAWWPRNFELQRGLLKSTKWCYVSLTEECGNPAIKIRKLDGKLQFFSSFHSLKLN